MTGKLRAEFDSIGLDKEIEPILSKLDEIIEYLSENAEMDFSSLDVIDYITDCMQSHLEDIGKLNEDNLGDSTNISMEEVWDILEPIGTEREIDSYISLKFKNDKSQHPEWNAHDWETDFLSYIMDKSEYLGDDFIHEEVLLKERMRRNAGL